MAEGAVRWPQEVGVCTRPCGGILTPCITQPPSRAWSLPDVWDLTLVLCLFFSPPLVWLSSGDSVGFLQLQPFGKDKMRRRL